MNLIPSVIEKCSGGERAYDIYSRLLKDRIVLLCGEIDDNTSNIIIGELLYLDSLNHNDISLYINSPGGSVTAGMAIYDTMNFIKVMYQLYVSVCVLVWQHFFLSSGEKEKDMPYQIVK